MGKVVRKAAPIIGAVAGIGAVIASGGSLAIFGSVAGASLFGVSASTLALVASGAGVASSLFAKKPQGAGASPAQLSRLQPSLDPDTPRKIVFGQTAFPADIRYQEASGANQQYIDYIIAVAAHQVESIDEIWFEEKRAWTAAGGVQAPYTGYLTVTTRTVGTAANTIAINGGAKWGSDDRLTGCAYVHVRIKRLDDDDQASVLSNGLPGRVTIIGKGFKCYDPRFDSSVGGAGTQRADNQATWGGNASSRDNPIIQTLNYLLGWRINGKLSVGCGIPPKRIDMASFITAANVSDESIAMAAGGTQPRYRSAGVFSENDGRLAVIESLLSACAGSLRDSGGKLSVDILKNDLASPVVAFTTKDVLSDADWNPADELGSSFNVVRGRFTDPSSQSLYQMSEYGSVSLPSPDGIERVLSLDLPVVQNAAQAQRLAKQTLQRAQYAGTFQAEFNARALGCAIGDVVSLTFEPFGWAAKLFRVVDQTVSRSGRIALTMREESADIYQWDAEDSALVVPADPTVFDPANATVIRAAIWASQRADYRLVYNKPTNYGAHDPNAAYLLGDTVPNLDGTARYFAKVDVPAGQNITLTNGTYWGLLISGGGGADGIDGADAFGYIPPWSGQIGGTMRGAVIIDAFSPTSPNAGEIYVNATRITTPKGEEISLSPGVVLTPFGDFLAGEFFLAYTATSLSDRFGYTGGHPNLMAIWHKADGWYFVQDGGTQTKFTPVDSDIIIAAVKADTFNGGLTGLHLYVSGAAGLDGLPGLSIIEKLAYKRSAGQPATPNGGSYNFDTKVMTAPAGASPVIPSGTEQLWASVATAAKSGQGGIASFGPWSSYQPIAANGEGGVDGQSIDAIYRRSATLPATPANTSGVPSGWYGDPASVPAGAEPLWQSNRTKTPPATVFVHQQPFRVEGRDGLDGVSAFRLQTRTSNIEVGLDSVRKTGGADGWNTLAATLEPAVGGAQVSGILNTGTGGGAYIGLLENLASGLQFAQWTAYIIRQTNGIVLVGNGVGSNQVVMTSAPSGDRWGVRYDPTTGRITVIRNGAEVYTRTDGVKNKQSLFGVFSPYQIGVSIDGITFASAGASGDKGDDGDDAFNAVAQPAAVNLNYGPGGVPRGGQLPRRVMILGSFLDAAVGVSLSGLVTTNCGVTLGSNYVDITSVSGTDAEFELTATGLGAAAGKQQKVIVPIGAALDGTEGNRNARITFVNPTPGTTYTQVGGELAINADVNGDLIASFNCSYQSTNLAANFLYVGKIQASINGGAWTDVAGSQATGSTAYVQNTGTPSEPVYQVRGGSVSGGAAIDTTPEAAVRLRLMMYYSGNISGRTGGGSLFGERVVA